MQLSARDERIALLERRERELLSQLRSVEGVPVTQILGDLKHKQEQLFLQYMGKLKAGGAASDCDISDSSAAAKGMRDVFYGTIHDNGDEIDNLSGAQYLHVHVFYR